MFYKEKGFYISLVISVAAIAIVGLVCAGVMKKNDANNKKMVAEVTQAPTTTPAKVVTEEPELTKEPVVTQAPEETPKKEPVKTPKTKETISQNTVSAHFDQEKGLLWPVKGQVLLEYSPDQVIYFKTLAQYRTNPGIAIASKAGTQVKASADGTITKVYQDDETGTTISMDVGDGFTLTYGQLKNLKVKEGTHVKEGQILGMVAAPTKYYTEEGANLFYQVSQNKETVNPLVLLR